jgi:hypothetical protein
MEGATSMFSEAMQPVGIAANVIGTGAENVRERMMRPVKEFVVFTFQSLRHRIAMNRYGRRMRQSH